MSKKFASAWKAQNAAVNSARTHKHSLTCLITSYPHPKQFAIRALKRYSDKQHFFSNRFHPASHSENACILLLRNPESQARSNDQLSHGKKPRVWTAQRICNSSKATAADDPCSHCSLVPVASNESDANSITKHQWEPLSWRLFNIARDWFSQTIPNRRVWALLDELPNYRIPDEREVSLFERTSDWSFSILSHQNNLQLTRTLSRTSQFFLLLSYYTQSCFLLHIIAFCKMVRFLLSLFGAQFYMKRTL